MTWIVIGVILLVPLLLGVQLAGHISARRIMGKQVTGASGAIPSYRLKQYGHLPIFSRG